MALHWALLALVAPVLAGIVAGASRLFADPDAAIDALNRYALYIAFPAMVTNGLLSSELAIPSAPGFWLLVPLVLLATALLARASMRESAPTIALILAFGNVAYLGLPVVAAALGERAVPLASLAVAIHVSLALTIGPALLLRWSGSGDRLTSDLRRLIRQPLLWAPIVGLALRLVPSSARSPIAAVLDPIGRSAGPVALFLLGLYLYVNRARVRRIDLSDAAHVAFKTLLMPALALGGAVLLARFGWMSMPEARVLFVLSAMPAAITTFAIAREHGIGTDRVSRAIVLSTIASAATIPAAIWIALHALP